jgi:uncharacterized membrane protein (UPF0182 family)
MKSAAKKHSRLSARRFARDEDGHIVIFTTLMLTLVLTAGGHFLLGAIRPDAPAEKVSPAARIQLGILLAFILGVRVWGYWLDRYELNFSPRGTVTGASYTDINASLPALYLLIGVSVVAILLILGSLRRSGFLLPGSALGLLLVASIILQGAYPAAIQRLRVDPQELAREEVFIQRNIDATQAAYGALPKAGKPQPHEYTVLAAWVVERALQRGNARWARKWWEEGEKSTTKHRTYLRDTARPSNRRNTTHKL